MTSNRCFNTFNRGIQNSSDYVNARRQIVLYTDVAANIQNYNTASPAKTINGKSYNMNFLTSKPGTDTSGCLVGARSYDLLLDITKGQSYAQYTQNISSNISSNISNNIDKYDALSGNLYSMNYNNLTNGQISIDSSFNSVTSDISNVIIDPCGQLFFEPCLGETYEPFWVNKVDISFSQTDFFSYAAHSQPLLNFKFPNKVIFSQVCAANTNDAF